MWTMISFKVLRRARALLAERCAGLERWLPCSVASKGVCGLRPLYRSPGSDAIASSVTVLPIHTMEADVCVVTFFVAMRTDSNVVASANGDAPARALSWARARVEGIAIDY